MKNNWISRSAIQITCFRRIVNFDTDRLFIMFFFIDLELSWQYCMFYKEFGKRSSIYFNEFSN